jgi:hypothetical protein
LVPNRIVLAEAGTGEDTGSEKKAGRGESGPETEAKKEKSSSRSKSKSPKRFVPSEKIRAEQGVDFPYDI